MTEADDLIRTWKQVRSPLDSIGANPDLSDFVTNSRIKDAKIGHHIGLIEELYSENKIFFEKNDYLWTLNPKVYGSSTEFALQLRLLRALIIRAGWENSSLDLDYSLMVVRENLTPRYELWHAHTRDIESLRFICIPFSFLEASHLILRSFYNLEKFDFEKESTDTYLKTVFLNFLSGMFKGEDSDLPLFRTRLKNEIEYFRDCPYYLSEKSDDFEEDACYLLAEYVLFHEASHCLHRDVINRTLENEIRADSTALQLYMGTWGTRNQILRFFPGSDVSKIIIGPLIYSHMLSIFVLIRNALRSLVLKESYSKFKVEDDVVFREITLRAERLISTARKLPEFYYQGQAEGFEDDLMNFDTYHQKFLRYFDYVGNAVRYIPFEAIKILETNANK